MKLSNIYLAIRDQGPPRRFARNLLKGHLLGILSRRSHFTRTGKHKVMYNTKATAVKSAVAMGKKHGGYFSNYKCIYCNGYHIGRNSENKR